MSEHRTHRTACTPDGPGRAHHDLGHKDGRGRAIGADIFFDRRTYEPTASEAGGWYTLAPGTYYCWTPQATRDGTRYGACQDARHCASAEERDAEIKKYLADAAKRAAKLGRTATACTEEANMAAAQAIQDRWLNEESQYLLIETEEDRKLKYQPIAAFLARRGDAEAQAIKNAKLGEDLGGFSLVRALPETDACPKCGNQRYCDGEIGAEKGVGLDDDDLATCLRCNHSYQL